MNARMATVDDAAELVRLRTVLFGTHWDETWCEPVRQTFAAGLAAGAGDGLAAGPAAGPAAGLAAGQMAAFVVDRPGGGLAACAVGVIDSHLGGLTDPSPFAGYVLNVATDPDQRRRGHCRACMTALLDWFRDRGISRVDLRASAEAEPLYRSLGFARSPDPAMRLRL